ncbi:MAG: outer membrane beta-barrel protein [Bacteroidota bacterium]
MKKIIIAFSVLICSQSLYSQGWFDIGFKGGYGLNFLANKNFYNDRAFSPNISFGYMYGGKIGINFNQSHAVTLDVTSSLFQQSYYYSLFNADSITRSEYKRKIMFNSLNVLLMYRKASDGGYFEVGPQFSTLSRARGTDGFTQTANVDISENFVKSYYSAVMGFGGYLAGTDNFRVTLGFRFSYALNDVISSEGRKTNFPSITQYESYKSSNPVSAMMIIEMNYDVGYFTRSRCKKRKLNFLLFSKDK